MPNILLRSFTDKFKETYGVECVAALHHNKRMTNFHIHLIFSERQLLAEPIIKTATRNMFYDERGNHVRTKKEILDEAGNIRKRCKVIKKGEIYEKKLFISKNTRFKQEDFLDEVKLFYTRMINRWVTDEKDRLTVFDRNGPYLATKKIGKNNPKAEQIEKDNKLRMDWNREVDRAIISEVSMDDILQIKKEHITEPIKRSIELCGNKPQRLALILNMAITELVLLISRVLETARAIRNKILHTDVPKTDKTDFASNIVVDNTDNTSAIENMNEFYLSYKESQNAYAEYQQKTEDWKKSFGNTDNSMDKAETMSEKLARLQKEADSYRQYNRRMSNKLR